MSIINPNDTEIIRMKDHIHKIGARERKQINRSSVLSARQLNKAGLFSFLCINRINRLRLPFIGTDIFSSYKNVFRKRVILKTGVVNLSRLTVLTIFRRSQAVIDFTFRKNNHVIICLLMHTNGLFEANSFTKIQNLSKRVVFVIPCVVVTSMEMEMLLMQSVGIPYANYILLRIEDHNKTDWCH